MALEFSQGLLAATLGRQEVKIVLGTDIALVIGIDNDTVTRVAADFVTEGFKAGDSIYVKNATDSDDDIEGIVASAVVAGTITLPSGTFTTGEAATAEITVAAAEGGSWRNLLNGGTLDIYSGTKPTSASDDVGAGTKLIAYTGVTFDAAAWDAVNQRSYINITSVLTSNAVAGGTATWFRLTAFGNASTGSSTTAIRMDGTVGLSGDLQTTNTAISIGDPDSISSFKLYLPI